MSRFLAQKWRNERTQKRGGGETLVSIDVGQAEQRLAEAAGDGGEAADFDREWAYALIGRVFERLRLFHQARGRAAVFEALKGCLLGDGGPEIDTGFQNLCGIFSGAAGNLLSGGRRDPLEIPRKEDAAVGPGVIQLWNPATGARLAGPLEIPAEPWTMCRHPDEPWIAVLCADGSSQQPAFRHSITVPKDSHSCPSSDRAATFYRNLRRSLWFLPFHETRRNPRRSARPRAPRQRLAPLPRPQSGQHPPRSRNRPVVP